MVQQHLNFVGQLQPVPPLMLSKAVLLHQAGQQEVQAGQVLGSGDREMVKGRLHVTHPGKQDKCIL